MKRASQKGNISPNRLSAGKARNCLINNSLKNRCSNIFPSGTFVNQRLYIGFCKNTASCCNGINCFSTGSKTVQPRRISFQKGCHLVYKSPRSTGTSSVHSLLNSTGKIGNFSIFPTQLYYNISLGNKFFNSSRSSNNFLNKRNVKPLGNRKAA